MALPDGSRLDTRVEVAFEPEGGKTRMTLVQTGFPTAEMRDEYGSGWASILDALGRVATTRVAGGSSSYDRGGDS
jgi:hypothetical protein